MTHSQARSSGDTHPHARALLPLALWLGLLTGLAEVVVLCVQKFVFGKVLWRSAEAGWTIPLTYAAGFAAFGFVWDRAARVWPRVFVFAFGAMALGYLAAFSVLFLFYPQIHKYAAITLSVGVAVQLSRLIGRPSRFDVVRRRTLTGLIGVAASLTVGIRGAAIAQERSAVRAIRARPAQGPNVLLIVLDTVRAQNLGVYGYDGRTTPHLDAWSRRAARFQRASAAAPWTLPSHASMFTGRHPHELSTGWLTPLDGRRRVLAEFYASRGYLTAGIIANKGYCSREFGLHRGFAHYEDDGYAPAQMVWNTSLGRYVLDSRRLRRLTGQHQIVARRPAEEVTDRFLEWRERAAGDRRPFFAFLNYFDAHAPYIPREPFATLFGGHRPDEHRPLAHIRTVDAQAILSMVGRYDACIASVDAQLGRLFRALDEAGVGENTLVVVVGDHGEEFGEHGIFDHGNSLYEPSLHVPLLVSWPGKVPAGHVVEHDVSLRDLASTLVHLTHGEGAAFPGQPWNQLWEDAGSVEEHPIVSEVRFARGLPEWLPVSRGTMHALVLGGKKYIRNGDGTPELYDLRDDPLEQDDLSHTAAGRHLAQRLSARLDAILSA